MPALTAACTARASRAPHTERGPPNRWAAPPVGHAIVTASDGVPVPGTPCSISACDFA